MSGLSISRSKLHAAEALVPQAQHPTQATQDFIVQLRTICDLVLHAYLSKIADTAEKRHYLHALCTAVQGSGWTTLDSFLNMLHEFKIFDFDLSVFQPHYPRVLLATLKTSSDLSFYFEKFRSDRERSREFHYEEGLWNAFVATRYMRFLRTLSNSR